MGDYYVGRALDNKIGGYIIAEVLRKIHKEGVDLPFDLYVVNSVQEEVGLFGAKKIAKELRTVRTMAMCCSNFKVVGVLDELSTCSHSRNASCKIMLKSTASNSSARSKALRTTVPWRCFKV